MKKIIKIATVPQSLSVLLKGQFSFLKQKEFDVVGVSSPGEHLNNLFENEGVKIVAVRMERKISIFKDLQALIKLYIVFKKEKPLIIHSITPKAGLLSMLAGKFANVPIRLHTFTGLIFPTSTGFKQLLLITMDKILCWAATGLYPEGEGVKRDLLKFGITKKELRVLANGNVNGIDLEYFNEDKVENLSKEKLRNDLNISAEDFVFIYVGRLARDKGIKELVESFNQLGNQNLKLILVGPEEINDPIDPHTVSMISNNENIIPVGLKRDIRPYLAISRVLVLPSYREGFPNVVLQAGAMGVPCIVTDINGSNEIIQNYQNGIVVPVKNVCLLKNAMHELTKDVELYDSLRSMSRQMVADRYDRKLVWSAMLFEYEQLINREEGK